ncbi:hypothetical protein H2204_007557 [Knufia peltigerae]|uniref:LOV domain-containing protein n=1 Tax=Knufia peltigerae TaxID=1002370 RepID=A0AA38Y1G8_9EURO|nr:hypothetical protein H2204_007557 [Knufia peltigerae]
MDLERIKQNLRIRSGRAKKPRKLPAENPSVTPAKVSKVVEQPPVKANDTAKSPRVPSKPATPPSKEGIPSRPRGILTPLPVVESANISKPRPGLPHAATGSNFNLKLPEHWPRYGRSGIERPQRSPVLDKSSKGQSIRRTVSDNDTTDVLDFDLRPPPPRVKPPSIESLAELLFSARHLNVLVSKPQYLAAFTTFIRRYRPQYHDVIVGYIESQKAIKAVEYANAVAHSITSEATTVTRPTQVATLDKIFEDWNRSCFSTLIETALPMYITYNLVKVVTECLVNEITGRQTPLMRDLVGGLSEVFCLTDPNQPDNPIIYASEEFFRLTGYGVDDVIGHNCRFLQGVKTNRESVKRLRDDVRRGEETCETLLNYRRDGRAFINLLMTAPLHDDQGNVKYNIGAQIDVTGLVERGKGLDGFGSLLINRGLEQPAHKADGNPSYGDEQTVKKAHALGKLKELSEMFDLEESVAVNSRSRSLSRSTDDDEHSIGSRPRRIYGNYSSSEDHDGVSGDDEDATWKLAESGRSGLSGKLPGVYDSYMLIRAAPSLRIVFVSPRLRRRFGNIVQHPFLAHIGASPVTLAGLRESLGTGIPVSAKVNFMVNAGERRDGISIPAGSKPGNLGHHRVSWISATPLIGSDGKVGVWMIVVVERAKVPRDTKNDAAREPTNTIQPLTTRRLEMLEIQTRDVPDYTQQYRSKSPGRKERPIEDMPIKPKRLTDEIIEAPPGQVHRSYDMVPQRVGSDKDESNASKTPTEQTGVVTPTRPIASDGQQKAINVETVKTTDEAVDEGNRPGPEPEPVKVTSSEKESQEPEQVVDIQPETNPEPVKITCPEKESQYSEDVNIKLENEQPKPHTLIISEVDNSLMRSLSADQLDSAKIGSEPPSPNDSGFQEVPKHSHHHYSSEDEDTPRRPQARPGIFERTPPQSRPGTSSGHDASKSTPKHYMDYIRHHGSRPSSDYNRAMSGGMLSSSMYHEYHDFVEKDEQGDEEEEDEECARTPYSVD